MSVTVLLLWISCKKLTNNKRTVIDYLFEKSAPGGFDLIVMDIMMPEMNGYGAARGYQYAAKGVGKCIMSFDIIMIKKLPKKE